MLIKNTVNKDGKATTHYASLEKTKRTAHWIVQERLNLQRHDSRKQNNDTMQI